MAQRTRKRLTEIVLSKIGTFDGDGKKYTYRSLAAAMFPFEDPNKMAALLWKIVNEPDYRPKPSTRRRLDLLDAQLVDPCDACGEVHDVPWCVYEAEVEMMKPINGHIPQGSQVYNYKVCECGQPFVPNTPLRKRCYTCSKPAKMKRSES